MFSKIKLGILLVLITTLIFSCTNLGKPFTEVNHIPEGKALVYLFFTNYQDANIQKVNAAFLVKANNKPVVALEAGGYFPYLAEPGELTLTTKQTAKYKPARILDVAFSLEKTKSIILTTEVGRTYYIEGLYERKYISSVVKNWEETLNLRRVLDEMEAILKLEECNILPGYQTQN